MWSDPGGAVYAGNPTDAPRAMASSGAAVSRVRIRGALGGAEDMVPGRICVTEALLQRWPLQQLPCRSMDVQGLVVPMVVQEGRWQVRMYTGTEKLPGWTVRRGSGLGPLPHLSAHWNQDHISQCSQAFSLRPEPVSYLTCMPPPSDYNRPFPLVQRHVSFSLEPYLFPQTSVLLPPSDTRPQRTMLLWYLCR